MSLTRKFLSAMGIEDDKAEQIINAHLETVNPLKQERDDYKEKAEKMTSVQKDLDAANKKLQEFENSSDKDSWKVKYEAAVADKKQLQKDFDDYKSGVAEKELTAKKQSAYRNLLKECGISEKRLDAVMRVTDLKSVEFGEDGKIKDMDKLTESIKSEWAEFIGTTQTHGAGVPNPPAGGNGGNIPNTRAAQVAKAHYERIYGKGEETK